MNIVLALFSVSCLFYNLFQNKHFYFIWDFIKDQKVVVVYEKGRGVNEEIFDSYQTGYDFLTELSDMVNRSMSQSNTRYRSDREKTNDSTSKGFDRSRSRSPIDSKRGNKSCQEESSQNSAGFNNTTINFQPDVLDLNDCFNSGLKFDIYRNNIQDWNFGELKESLKNIEDLECGDIVSFYSDTISDVIRHQAIFTSKIN